MQFMALLSIVWCWGLRALATSAVYAVACSMYNRWRHPLRDVPGPFWASVTSLWYAWALRYGRGERYQAAIHRKYGPLVRVAPNLVSIADPAAIPVVYGTDPIFPKTSFYDGFQSGISPRRDIFSERVEEAHDRRRRAVAPVFVESNIRTYDATLDPLTDLFAARMGRAAETDEVIDLSVWLKKYAFDVLGVVVYGRRPAGFGFIRDDVDYHGWCHLLEVMPPVASAISYVPDGLKTLYLVLQFLSRRGREAVRGMATVIENAHAAVAERRRAGGMAKPRGQADILAQLLTLCDESGQRRQYDEKDVVTEIWAFIWAGADTTSSALSSIFYHLFTHDGAVKELRREIAEATAAGRLSHPIQYGQARQLPYLHAVVREAMRVLPSIGSGLPRTVPVGGAVLGGRRFHPGCEVVMNPNVVHFDRSIFGEDATSFRPERWLEHPRRAAEMERHLLGFGHGPRNCVGKHISQMEMYKLVPAIVQDFDFTIQRDWTVFRGWFQQPSEVMVRVRRRGPSTGGTVLA